jgi:hypothetical protein
MPSVVTSRRSTACLSRVKTLRHSLASLDLGLKVALHQAFERSEPAIEPTEWLKHWYAPRALSELLSYRQVISELDPDVAMVARVILSRAARSARLTTHFDLDFPSQPITSPYFCHKHKRTCRPVEEAAKFLRRYRASRRLVEKYIAVMHGKAKTNTYQADPNITVLGSDDFWAKISGIPDFRARLLQASRILAVLVEGRAAAEAARIKDEARAIFGDEQGNLRVDVLANPPPKPRARNPSAPQGDGLRVSDAAASAVPESMSELADPGSESSPRVP